ncbi:MAG: hypothetical protein V4493_01300 [Pseudomonadota bacterium]
MIISYSNARDEIFKQFGTVLSAVSTLLTYTPEIIYQGVETGAKMPTDKLWMRVSQQTITEEQAGPKADAVRRYTSDGLVFVQLFIAKTKVENYAIGTQVAQLVKTAFRGKQTTGCIWFRNVRIQELPSEDAWYRLNVVSEYQYDEIS